MAKRKNQESVKHDFFRRLERGTDVDIAASKSGINDDELIRQYLDEFHQSKGSSIADKLHLESLQTAIYTLKEIADRGVDEDRIRCDAAKALLKFASDNLKNKTDEKAASKSMSVTVSPEANLWDF